MMKTTPFLPGALALGAALTLAADTAWAGAFAVARFGADHGHPATDHPTAIYYNPAGLSHTRGTRLYVEGMLANRRGSYERAEGAVDNALEEGEQGTGTPPDALDANAGTAEVSDLLQTPFVGLSSDLGGSNFGFGVALYAPFGGSSNWPNNTDFAESDAYPGALDGVQRWHVIEGSLMSMYLTAAGSYHVEPAGLTAGVAVHAIRSQVDTVRARTATGTDDMVDGSGEIFEGRSLLQADSIDVGLGAGLRWDPLEELTIGASYQSVPGLGEMEMEGRVVNIFGAAQPSETDVVLTQTLPDIYRLGFAYRVPEIDSEFRVSGDYQRWSVFENQCVMGENPDAECAIAEDGSVDEEAGGSNVLLNIPRHYEDTWGVRAGGSYWPIDDAETFLSLAYDGNAIPDETLDPSIVDAEKFAVTIGGRYELPAEGSAVSAGLMHTFYGTREVEPRERDENGQPIAPEPPSRNPDAAGVYDQSVTLFTLGMEGQF